MEWATSLILPLCRLTGPLDKGPTARAPQAPLLIRPWSLVRVGRAVGITFIYDYQERARDKVLVISVYTAEDGHFLGRRGEGGELVLGLIEPRTGGRNHLPGVSGHWLGSEGSGVLLGISSITGGRSSRGKREVAAASGGSTPTYIATSGNSARGGVCAGSVSSLLAVSNTEIASRKGSAI